MGKNLVIVESPAKCRTISRYLGGDYQVKATMGHIIDLPEKELGVDLEHDFKPKYTTSKGKRRVVKMLREEAAKCDTVFLAPDPDREGEAIAWHVAQTIAKQNTNIKRVQFNEITKRAVSAAFADPRDIDTNKVNAQQARRILDRIVGYQVSPVLWRTVFRGLSAGRVQSVALRLICEREDEIKAFVQEEYWSILAMLEHKDKVFAAKLQQWKGEKVRIPNQAAANEIIDGLRDKDFVITDVTTSEKVRKPYAPFITSTLQQEAARKLGFSAAKTMMIAQQLYEGLELGDLGTLGLITYMRTDSTRVADEALTAAQNVISTVFGENYKFPGGARTYGKKKNVQDAHEAIRPSQVDVTFSPDKVKKYLSRDQHRLYEVIWKRFLASQMANAVFDSTRIDVTAGDAMFRATGSVMKFDGFLAIYDESREDSTDSEGNNDSLPRMEMNTRLNLKDLQGKQHFTQPPPRYTEALLVRELEDKGIGRPSTYAQIIDTLKRRKYVELASKRFVPTEVGFMVRDILVREFSEVFEVGFTADMESALDRIETGDADWVEVLRDFYGPFSTRLEHVKHEIKELRARNQEVTDRMCPECQKFNLVIKWSKNGKFLACQGFPACKYTEPLQKVEAAQTDEKCDKCGAPMVVLTIKNNRFLGCSKYPECKFTKSLSTGVKCPEPDCEGTLIERNTRRGKLFYGCSKYPTCTFATWDKPVDTPCDHCGFPMLVQRETKRKGTYTRCLKCRNETTITPPEEGESEDAA